MITKRKDHLEKIRLDEINLIRPIVIILLVVYHSFIIYTGGWYPLEMIKECQAYFWIAKISYSGMLEMFTFISGYLFSLALLSKKDKFSTLLIKKLKRTILPSILFSIIYTIFRFNEYNFFTLEYIYQILNGVGHMWFLPMLFWCFIITYLLEKINMPIRNKLFGLLILMLFSALSLPFRLSSTCYYLFFFYLGKVLFQHKEALQTVNVKKISFFILSYIVLIISNTLAGKYLNNVQVEPFILEVIKKILFLYSKAFNAGVGIFVGYLISLKVLKTHTLPYWIINFNKYCFGIYLFQQFILIFLYYNTNFPTLLGTYLLPWVALGLTLIFSFIFSYLLLKTKIGRILIG